MAQMPAALTEPVFGALGISSYSLLHAVAAGLCGKAEVDSEDAKTQVCLGPQP